MKKKKAIVSVTNDLYTDQRVHKVCTFLMENNYDVLLVGRLLPDSKAIDRKYRTHRIKLKFTKGPKFYAFYNLRLFYFLLFKKADLLLANDLDTLLANYTVCKLKRKCRLVYDTHEYFTEVPELVARPKIKRFWERIEEAIFPKLNTVYTVNKSIASRYAEKYNKDVKIVRNISPLWTAKNIKSKEELNLPENKKIIILQGAGINVDRGAEEAVDAMQFIEDTLLLFVGSGDIIEDLKQRVIDKKLNNKVCFIGRVPYDIMMNYTYHADLGLTLDKDTNLNYKFSLPNKVFDYIHTNTPVLASNVIEVAKIVNENNVGITIKNHNPKHIADCITSIIFNPSYHKELVENCKKTALVLNWEKECEVLKKIYT